MKTEVIVLNEERNVSLTAYIQQTGGEFPFTERPAMVVIPGGAYNVCADVECDPVALAYARAGYQTFILRYTLSAKGGWPRPLEDYENAMEMILSRAEEWHVAKDKIAIVGFSAGGHLAACAATVGQHKPAAALLIYPGLLPNLVDAMQPGAPYPADEVNEDTPPCFIATAWDDPIDVENSLTFELALNRHHVPFESHIYNYGGHGYATAEPWLQVYPASPRLKNWVDDSLAWLADTLGQLTRAGFTAPNPHVQKSGDGAATLSVDCTFEHIIHQGVEVRRILAPIFAAVHLDPEGEEASFEKLLSMVGSSKVVNLLKTVGVPEEEIQRIDQQLRTFANKHS